MCGGDIEFAPGATYGTCEYCGSTSTIPKAADEGKLNRYNRANHFRRQCEFDKAVAAYEKILEQDDTDAEAHWGAVISRYGIEYVEDPATKKRIPTCHRVQLTSILADEDYKAAVEYAPDAESRRLYEEEAARIAEIQKGILAISQHEKPYDVFICYKETDYNGQRTHDSQWAQDIYYGLTEQGYKVFFSRITLEDKLGQQYEPYIFAALSSAKVMVVVGSKPEYFNAVWVKNEWSRYLALMAKDRTRLLIPCYRDMDPYDLPEELSTLQSQDMGKIGFMQDLLRGVKKVLETDKKPEQSKTVQQEAQASATGIAPGISSLMERTYLFMEDGDFDSATDYINRVLDIDPKYAPAYAAKVCVTFRLRKESDLAETTFLYEDNADWQKAIRFADSKQKTTYAGYIAQVKVRVARQIRNYAYDCAMEMAVTPQSDQSQLDSALSSYKASCTHSDSSRADGSRRKNSQLNEDSFKQAVRTNEPGDVSEQGFKHAAAMFDNIKDSDATECAKQCRILAEQARQKLIYNNAVTAHIDNRYNVTGLEETAALFLSVPQYKDAKEQAQHCMDEAETIRDGWYSDAIKAMQEAGDESKKWKKVKNALALSSLDDYRDVAQLRAQATKRYEECLAAEKEAQRKIEEQARREAKAAAEKKRLKTILVILAAVVAVVAFLVVTRVIIPRINYKKAERLRANGQYAEAVAAFTNAGRYSDAEMQISATYYAEGEAKRDAAEWEGAVAAFTNAGSYSDAETQIPATYYAEGEAKRDAADWKGALAAFTKAGSYSDAEMQILATYYAEGKAKRDAADWEGAVAAFTNARSYGDTETQILATYYAEGKAKREAADWEGALAAFTNAGSYNDADMQIPATYYAEGETKRETADWAGALVAFTNAGSYGDAETQITETKYQQTKFLAGKKDYTGAAKILTTIRGYKDVDNLIANDQDIAAAVAREPYTQVGNMVLYGHYEQDSNLSNGKEAIEWIVLAYDSGKGRALLLSRYGLDAHRFDANKYQGWDKSEIRKWLNSTFLDNAFTVSEQEGIATTKVSTPRYNGTSGGADTEDKIWLLSRDEATTYFTNDESRKAIPTKYAMAQGIWQGGISFSNSNLNGIGCCWWWLRSPADGPYGASLVYPDGRLFGCGVYSTDICIRPAFWINLDSADIH